MHCTVLVICPSVLSSDLFYWHSTLFHSVPLFRVKTFSEHIILMRHCSRFLCTVLFCIAGKNQFNSGTLSTVLQQAMDVSLPGWSTCLNDKLQWHDGCAHNVIRLNQNIADVCSDCVAHNLSSSTIELRWAYGHTGGCSVYHSVTLVTSPKLKHRRVVFRIVEELFCCDDLFRFFPRKREKRVYWQLNELDYKHKRLKIQNTG